MNDLNYGQITGRLTKEPEIKFNKTGGAIMNISIASNVENHQTQFKHTNYFDCVLFGKPVEWYKDLKKGDAVNINYQLWLEQWKSDDGKNRQKVQLKVMRIDRVQIYKKDGSSLPNTDDSPVLDKVDF